VNRTSSEQRSQIHAILESLDRGNAGASQNRRAAPRLPIRMGLPAIVLLGAGAVAAAPVRIYTRNISRSGVGFVSRRMFKPNERLALSFQLPGHPPKIVLAQITFARYLRDALYESGARFLEAIADTAGLENIPAHWCKSN
jgi:hypothetical protein